MAVLAYKILCSNIVDSLLYDLLEHYVTLGR